MILDLKKGQILQIAGETEVNIMSGEVEIVGQRISGKEIIKIPYGKSLPIEVIEPTVVSIEFLRGGKYEYLPERTIPEEWDLLLARCLSENVKRILILGGMDTGKSFLATYLANKFLTNNKRVAVLDCDPGQSDIGPPATIGLSILKKPVFFLPNAEVTAMYFVGGHSPSLHLLPFITGIAKLKEKALNVDILIVNTTGWIFGDGARLLKKAKIEIISPDIIVLLQKTNELEHIVRNYNHTKICRLKVPSKATHTPRGARKDLRELISMRYFKNSREIVFMFDEIKTDRCYFRTGVQVYIEDYPYAEKLPEPGTCLIVSRNPLTALEKKKLSEKGYNNIKNIIIGEEQGLLLGLLDKADETLGLGILKKIDYKAKKIHIITPVKENKKNIKAIQFGSVKYTFDGKEAGFIEPGKF